MSIIEQIKQSKTEEELFKLIEEHIIDIETPLSWGEEATVLEQQGQKDKAEILRAAENHLRELEKI